MPDHHNGNGHCDSPTDLERFGFDADDAGWIDRLRAATSPLHLGCIGPYEIIEEIGRGGQGVIYRARQPGTERTVAIKRFLGARATSSSARLRFEHEVRAISAMKHPNIVTVFAMDVVDGLPVFAMEWVDGQPVTQWARGRPVRDLVVVFARICDAVHHAHQRGVIHRDLKPSNLLIDGSGEPRVLDFGLAQSLPDESTNASSEGDAREFSGTPAYAAPEQLGGGAADVRSDVYSLGLVLKESLACAALAASGTRYEVDAVLGRSIAPAPEARYASMEAMGADLRRILSGEPVSVLANRPSYVARKFLKRHSGWLALSVLVLVVLTALAIWGTLSARAARLARDDERRARAVSERVNAFLQATLSSALPSRGGADVSLMSAITDAAERAETELADEPQVAAEVHHTIGSTLNALWRWREALPHLEKSVQLSRQDGGLDPVRFSNRLVELARTLTSLQRPEAILIIEEALAVRRRACGHESAAVAEGLMRLAYAKHQASADPKWEEAGSLFEQAIAMYQRLPGDHRRDIASCLHNYGWLYYRQARYAEADDCYARALALYRDLGDRRDPFYAELLHGYTSLLLLRDRNAESLQMLEEAIPLVRPVYGEPGAEALYWRAALACQRLGRLEDARSWYVQAIDAFSRGAARESEDERLHAKLHEVRHRVANWKPGDLPPFESLYEAMPMLSESRVRRLARYRENFDQFLSEAVSKDSSPPAP